jgi:hypothetical protein
MAILVIYIGITFFETPEWCIDNPKITDKVHCNDAEGHYSNSGIPKISREWSLPIDMLLLVLLIVSKLMGRLYKHHTVDSKRFETMLIGMMVISLIDIVADLILYPTYRFPYIACYIRPIVFSITMRSLREQWKRYLYVIHDSAQMVIFIATYILFFSWVGYRLFRGTPEGIENFSTFGESAFGLLVLMTTANFPDFMLPAYQVNRLNCIFFIGYLIFGLFLLMNLLLAIFYSNYQIRF